MRFPWVRRVVSPGSSKTHTLENPSWTSSAATWHKRKQRISHWLHKAQRIHHRHHSYQNATLRYYSPYEINLPRLRKVDSMHGSDSSEFLRIATENPSLNFTICFKKDYEYTALYLNANWIAHISWAHFRGSASKSPQTPGRAHVNNWAIAALILFGAIVFFSEYNRVIFCFWLRTILGGVFLPHSQVWCRNH